MIKSRKFSAGLRYVQSLITGQNYTKAAELFNYIKEYDSNYVNTLRSVLFNKGITIFNDNPQTAIKFVMYKDLNPRELPSILASKQCLDFKSNMFYFQLQEYLDGFFNNGSSADNQDNLDTKGGKAACWWWLRSPGFSQNYAAGVSSDGSVNCYGNNVSYEDDCVRPALWINPGE